MATIRSTENACKILDLLIESGGMTSADLIANQSLKRSSVYYVCEWLSDAGLISSETIPSKGKGRPTVNWTMNPSAGTFLVVYLGNTQISFGNYDLMGELITKRSVVAPGTFDEALKLIATELADDANSDLLGIHLVLGGVVHSDRQTVLYGARWGLKDVNLAERIRTVVPNSKDMLVMVGNNASMAAWGESQRLRQEGILDFLTLHLHGAPSDKKRIGFGSGLVLDGQLVQGHRGTTGEITNMMPACIPSVFETDATTVGEKAAAKFSTVCNYFSPEKILLICDECPVSETFVRGFDSALRSRLLFQEHFEGTEMIVDGIGSVLAGAGRHLARAFMADVDHVACLLSDRKRLKTTKSA
jgi:hypothetical protein